MKNISQGEKSNSIQSALVNKINGSNIPENDYKDGVNVFIRKEDQKMVIRDSSEEITLFYYSGLKFINVPLSKKDTDTKGRLLIHVVRFGALESNNILMVE